MTSVGSDVTLKQIWRVCDWIMILKCHQNETPFDLVPHYAKKLQSSIVLSGSRPEILSRTLSSPYSGRRYVQVRCASENINDILVV